MFTQLLVLCAPSLEGHTCLDAIWHVAEERQELCVGQLAPNLADRGSELCLVGWALVRLNAIVHQKPHVLDGVEVRRERGVLDDVRVHNYGGGRRRFLQLAHEEPTS